MMSIKSSRIAILIATYNGEHFLEKQLLTLIAQEDVTFDVIANDDGSTDSTIAILKEYQSRGLVKKLLHTQNVGPTSAFINLLKNSREYDFVALCDQDDSWDKDKLKSSIMKFSSDCPEIVISERRYIDVSDRIVGYSPKPSRKFTLNNALVENVAYGNTIVMNSLATELVIENMPANIDIDHWIYLVISALGRVSHIPRTLISYRLHESNFIGTSRLKALTRFQRNIKKAHNQAFGLLSGYSDRLSLENRTTIENYLSIWRTKSPFNIIKILIHLNVYRQRRIETFLYKFGLFLAATLYSRPTLRSSSDKV
jgi:glycosyltransferase involved in cell wall biosynthesis